MPVVFRPVDVRADGPQTVAISGVEPGEWVVVVGQHLLTTQGDAATAQARVRVVAWERILDLQGLQRQDLLEDFMDKQERLAGERQKTGRSGEQGTSGSRQGGRGR
jgi:hypothetical protein